MNTKANNQTPIDIEPIIQFAKAFPVSPEFFREWMKVILANGRQLEPDVIAMIEEYLRQNSKRIHSPTN